MGVTDGHRERALDQVIRNHVARRRALGKAKALLALRLAPDFTPFEFVRTDELGLSRLIGWLCDYRGSPGQRDVFLKCFLDMRDLRSLREVVGSNFSYARVQYETVTRQLPQNRRLDIRIESDVAVIGSKTNHSQAFRITKLLIT